MDSLDERRKKLCPKFAKNCLKTEKIKDVFPKNTSGNEVNTRKKQKYKVNLIRTERYKKSAIPYMKNLLNDDYSERQRILV